MKSQKVKNVSYFCKSEFELKDGKKDVVILPQNAEIVSVNLEVTKGVTGGSVSIGVDEEASYFLNNIATTTAGFNQSSKWLTTKKQTQITASITGITSNTNGAKGILRVVYFLPSEILVEY